MKLVLYSGGQSRSNHKLHSAIEALARENPEKNSDRKLKLTYIPFCSEGSSLYYHRAIRRYRSHGIQKFQCLNVDNAPTQDEIKDALKSDIIYLSGGNTFYFLKHLREANILDKLKTFAKEGGVLAGLSAGALIMSPTIRSAAVPELDPDDNEVQLKQLKGMGLFNFEFSPHFDYENRQIQAHLSYSKKTKYPVMAVEDGSGIVINNKDLAVYGSVYVFHKGKHRSLVP